MFEIKMVDGQEIRETKGDTFTLNPNTGVLTISRSTDSRKPRCTTRRRRGPR